MTQPVKVILDTDIGPDCDDTAALAILHALADRGEADILGVAHCTSSPWGAGCIDAVNAYYGRPDIPVGTLKEPGFLDGPAYCKYNRVLCEEYPNRYRGGQQPGDAVTLYRELLAGQPDDGGVVVVAIGPLIDLRLLLQSGADGCSPLTGPELVRRKVSRLVVMGGKFPAGLEWNFEMDGASARYVAERWPTPIVFSGWEAGSDIVTGARLFRDAPPQHPVRRAYELYLGGPAGRSSWDLTAVLYAVRGCERYWDVSAPGYVEVQPDGSNTWREDTDRGHRYMIRCAEANDIADALEELLVQPPAAGRSLQQPE